MAKLIIVLIVSVIVCFTIGYTANRVCDTIDKSGSTSSGEHNELHKEHESIMRSGLEIGRVVNENNKMLTFIYNIAKGSQNPDLAK